MQVSLKWDEKPYDNVLNNQPIIDLYEANGNKLGALFTQDPVLKNMYTGSTDMGNVTHVIPGIHPHFMIDSKAPAHTHGFCEAAGLFKFRFSWCNASSSCTRVFMSVSCNCMQKIL